MNHTNNLRAQIQVEKDHLQLKKNPQHSEELVEFCDRVKGALIYMRGLEEKIDKIKGFNPEEVLLFTHINFLSRALIQK